MENRRTIDRLTRLRGSPVYSRDGDEIGSVEGIVRGDHGGEPEWIRLMPGRSGTKSLLVPLEGADLRPDAVYVAYTSEQVASSPAVEAGEPNGASERALFAHYGLAEPRPRSLTRLREGRRRTGAVVDLEAEDGEGRAEVTRHEEELRIGRRIEESGRARLRKSVESEPVDAHVELEREVGHVERQPIGQPFPGAKFGDAEVEIPVYAERPLVEKETFAERVSLEKDVETKRATIGDEVRREHVAVEGAVEGEGQERDRPGKIGDRASIVETARNAGRRQTPFAVAKGKAGTAALATVGFALVAWRARARRRRGSKTKGGAGMAKEPEEIRREIEETRADMGETVEALAYKTDVKTRARNAVTEKKDAVVEKTGSLRSRVMERLPGGGGRGGARAAAATARERARETAGRARERTKEAAGRARENPLGLGAVAAAVGFLAGMLAPSTRVEQEKIGPAAEQVREQVKETGQEALERGKEVAKEAAQSAKETAKERGQEHGQELSASVKEKAQEAKPGS